MSDTVISQPLLPLIFENDSDWNFTGWFVNGTSLLYIRGSKENYIKIDKKFIDELGYYFFVIEVGSLTSGNIILKNRKNDILLTIKQEGVHYLELYIDNPNYEELSFEFTSAFVESTATITSIGVYKVTRRIKDYIAYVLSNKEDYIEENNEDSIYDEKIPGSTMTPNNIISKRTTIQEIELNDSLITKLSQDYLESGIKSIPSSKALFDAINNLDTHISSIDPNNNLFIDNTVITLPLLPTAFEENSDWNFYNWSINNGSLFYSGNELENYIKIQPEFLTYSGYYFFTIDVSRLDSGAIILKNTKNETLLTIDDIGIHYFEIYVPDSNAETFTLEAINVYTNEVVQITSIGLYRVTDRLKNYLVYFLTERESNDSIVTKEYLEQEIDILQKNLSTLVENSVTEVSEDLLAHMQNEDNPHNTTPAKIGAATTNHTHTPSSIGAADREHTHEPEECGAAPLVHTHSQYVDYNNLEDAVNDIISNSGSSGNIAGIEKNLTDHINNTSNPHNVTREQLGLGGLPNNVKMSDSISSNSSTTIATSKAIKTVQDNLNSHIQDQNNPHGTTPSIIGAAEKVHSHTPSECGAAPTNHTHSEYLLKSDVSEEVTTIVSSSLSEIRRSINSHIQDKNNPHNVTTDQIGAATKIHTHELSDIGPNGAADATHEHPQYTDYQASNDVATSVAEGLISEALFTDISGEEDPEPILVSKYVDKESNETITGIKTFSTNIDITRANSPYLKLKNSDFTLGEDPSSNRYWNIDFSDSKGDVIGDILYYHNTDANNGDTCIEFRILSIDGVPVTDITEEINYTLGIRYDKSEEIFYGFAPNPEESSNTNHIATTKWVTDKLNSSHQSMPVGSVYFQLANQPDPTTLFGGTWSNISSTYPGMFFRAEGGSAAAFGSSQSGGLPNATGVAHNLRTLGGGAYSESFYSSQVINSSGFTGNENKSVGGFSMDLSRSNSLYGAANEVRPVNSTIRIWKRTA